MRLDLDLIAVASDIAATALSMTFDSPLDPDHGPLWLHIEWNDAIWRELRDEAIALRTTIPFAEYTEAAARPELRRLVVSLLQHAVTDDAAGEAVQP